MPATALRASCSTATAGGRRTTCENAYPAEVEKALSRHPAVIEAAVVGAPAAGFA